MENKIKALEGRLDLNGRLLPPAIAVFAVLVGSLTGLAKAGEFGILFWLGMAVAAAIGVIGVCLYHQAGNTIKKMEETKNDN